MATPDYQEPKCAQPSVEERLQSLQGNVNALYRLIPDEIERRLEGERKARWHATYNAAISRIRLNDITDSDGVTLNSKLHDAALLAHGIATCQADYAHGPLEPAGER